MLPTNINRSIVTTFFAFLAGFLFFFAAPQNVQAQDNWAINAGVSFLYINSPSSTTDDGNNGKTIHYFGGIVDIQPEYRFNSWFGLGVDVEIGGLGSSFARAKHKHFYFHGFVTAKFIADLEKVDLWAEIGLGAGTMVGDYLARGSVKHGADWTLLPRLRIGFDFDIAPKQKIGLHAGVASGIPLESVFVTFGAHYTFSI